MGNDFQQDRAVLAMEVAGRERFAQATLDHAEDRLDLPTLSVATPLRRPLEVLLHLPPIATGRRLVGRPTDCGRNDRSNVQLVAQELMHPLAVVPRVAQQRVDAATLGRRQHCVDQMRMIGRRPAAGNRREDQVAGAIAHQADFRKSPIGRRLLGFAAFGASPHKVVTGVMGLEPAAIDRGQLRAFLEDLCLVGRDKRLIQEAVRGVFFSRRSAALCKVVQCGTTVRSIASHRSVQSARRLTTPR